MVLITFSGLDGAGKSTLIEWLQGQLESQQRRVTVAHFNDHIGIYACLRAVRDRISGRPSIEAPPRLHRRTDLWGRMRDGLVWSRTVRQLVYPVDLVIFVAYRTFVEKVMRRVLIMDRYFYDRIVDVMDRPTSPLIRWFARLAPTPDLPILLSIDPEEAFARKGEYTVPYLRRRAELYGHLFPLVRTGVCLPAQELERTKDLLAHVMRKRLSP